MDKRIVSMNCRFLLVLMLYTILISVSGRNAVSENNDFRQSDGTMDAYAWTDEYLYIAHGFSLEGETDWQPIHYSIRCVNKNNWSETILIGQLDGTNVNLFTDEDTLYVLWSSQNKKYVYMSNAVNILCIDTKTNLVKHIASVKLNNDEELIDSTMYNGKVYLFSENRVVEWNMKETRDVYLFKEQCGNTFYDNHVMIDEDKLILLDGNTIIGLDIHTFDAAEICEINTLRMFSDLYDDRLYRTRSRVATWQYDYMAIDGILYFYDIVKQATIAYNMSDMIYEVYSLDEYYFYSFADNYLVYWVLQQNETDFDAHCYLFNTADGLIESTSSIELSDSIIPIGNELFIHPNNWIRKIYELNEGSIVEMLELEQYPEDKW